MLTIRSILVLCVGNHCRSPLAEALLRQGLGTFVDVRSAGLRALVGHPVEPEAMRLAHEAGLDLTRHVGRSMEETQVLASDLILVMEERHREEVLARYPVIRGRVFLLGHWLEGVMRSIPDPYRRGPKAMRESFDHIKHAVDAWIYRISPRGGA